jgi:hypothetical protein
VAKIENATEKERNAERGLGLQKLTLQSPMPQRPGYGTQGKSILLWANYFELSANQTSFHRYSIEALASDNNMLKSRLRLWAALTIALEI